MKLLTEGWLKLDWRWKGWVEQASDDLLKGSITYRNMKGEEFCQPLYQIIHHLFNHMTYHRGQLVTMLRQAGAEQIPGTDFIAWARTR